MSVSLGSTPSTSYLEEAPPAYSSIEATESVVGFHSNLLDHLKRKLGMRFSNYNNAFKILVFRHRLRLYDLYQIQDHTLPVRIHLLQRGIDVPCGLIDQSEDDCKLQRMKDIEIETIVNQEISFFVRVYQQGHEGKQPSQKDVIDYFDAWDYAVQYHEATTLEHTRLSTE